MPTHFFIKPTDVDDKYVDSYEDDIVCAVFENYLPLVSRSKQRPFLMDENSYPKLIDIVKERDFFVFWLRDTARAEQSYYHSSDDNDPFNENTTYSSFDTPKDAITDHVQNWLANENVVLDKTMTSSFVNSVLMKKSKSHFVNEYYGDSSNYDYLHFEKNELLKLANDFTHKPSKKNLHKVS